MAPKWKWIFLVSAVFLVFVVAGCASTPQPFVYHDDREEKPGSGLLSGDEGGFVIYGQSPEKTDSTKEQPPKDDPQ
ncbi:hypothetical protein [uncultured Desulfosarcina sp.]|uniref:hypothetical protein n=1 Tax=uncultured Desulfosarcina sp. TaxID=218289 RepID=UPI0029C8CE84|nr:hypothetical protein [uncultured Desulfosarcina sp.]